MAQFLNVTARESITSKWMADSTGEIKMLDDTKDTNSMWSCDRIKEEIANVSLDLWTY